MGNVIVTAILAGSLAACGGDDNRASANNALAATAGSSITSATLTVPRQTDSSMPSETTPTPGISTNSSPSIAAEPVPAAVPNETKTSTGVTTPVVTTPSAGTEIISTAAANPDTPIGFGAATTGGAGGEIVSVTTPQELRQALCSTFDGTTCTDKTPRIIQVKSLVDFINTEGITVGQGCTYSANSCMSKSGKQERILKWGNYCTAGELYTINYDTAGGKPLAVGSNKTIVGIGNAAGLKGKGLYIGSSASNIIIRNLSFTDINEGIVWAGDAITIDNASKIWIDHNYFARIGRQMIVTGWGTATATTISNNFFDGQSEYGHYCDDRHYWVLLLNADKQEITLFGNRFHRTSGRVPETGKPEGGTGGIIHIVNNLYTDNYYMGVGPTPEVNLLIEGNYFTLTGNYFFPIFTTNDQDLVYAPLDETLSSTDASCIAALGRPCGPSYSQTEHGSFRLNAQVLNAVAGNTAWKKATSTVVPLKYSEVYDYVIKNAGPQTNLK
jgi:pectate lyase